MIAIMLVYVVVGAILLVLLAGFEGPTVTQALRGDLRALRTRGSLAVATGGPVWVAGAVVAWPLVAACEAIAWHERA
ncbi:hypothetical protein BJF90_13080 [Pseudonocardia sp. CNS-004]|nr:hypothetical protein BJF90_13080 [Pseudonocardia sp. CNS-004]